MKLLIMPCSRKLLNGNISPKDYPYWKEVVDLLPAKYDVEVCNTIIPLDKLESYLKGFDKIVTIDSFLQHYCWLKGIKCIVVFSKSDPLIFGHPENVNVLKDRKYLRPDQFNIWELTSYDKESFVDPEELVKIIEGN